MKKKKLYVQIAVCLVISLFALYGSKTNHSAVVKTYETAKALIMEQITWEDVTTAWSQMTALLSDAPSKVVSAVTAVNEASKYGEPIDEKSDTRMKQVHAVAGGMVLKSGKNDEYGLYVQIKHDSAVSVYGNLAGVSVVESERVQRGEIIGSYDSFSDTQFYYELRENL